MKELFQQGERSLHRAREVDRVRCLLEGLIHRVPLDIRSAGCYSEDDKRAIWSDIRAEVDAVNKMIARQMLDALARGLHSTVERILSSTSSAVSASLPASSSNLSADTANSQLSEADPFSQQRLTSIVPGHIPSER